MHIPPCCSLNIIFKSTWLFCTNISFSWLNTFLYVTPVKMTLPKYTISDDVNTAEFNLHLIGLHPRTMWSRSPNVSCIVKIPNHIVTRKPLPNGVPIHHGLHRMVNQRYHMFWHSRAPWRYLLPRLYWVIFIQCVKQSKKNKLYAKRTH